MTPTQLAAATLIVIAGIGIVVAVLIGPLLRRRGTMDPRVVRARAMSYAALAGILAVAILIGLPALTVMFAAIAAVALLEWSRLADLPVHHVIALEIGSLAIMVATALRGAATADLLVGGLVLAGALMPVVRPDTNRAIRDFGLAAVGLIILSVMLAHGVALAAERGRVGRPAGGRRLPRLRRSDVGAFIVGKRFGSVPLAPSLSPNKTREGLIGNILGAAVGIAILAPALSSVGGPLLFVGLVVIVGLGSVWGDLLESAAKREFGVKDAGSWLPGFGGILDRVDSLLLALPLTYWALRLADTGYRLTCPPGSSRQSPASDARSSTGSSVRSSAHSSAGRGSRVASGSSTCRGRCSSAPTTRAISTSRSSVARSDGTADIASRSPPQTTTGSSDGSTSSSCRGSRRSRFDGWGGAPSRSAPWKDCSTTAGASSSFPRARGAGPARSASSSPGPD